MTEMPADYSRFWPFLIAVAAVLLIYRRLRRSFGKQPVKPVRMRIRMGILLLLGVTMAPAAFKSLQFLSAETAGLAAGILLALWGASRTRFQAQGAQLYYLPHSYTGVVVSLLFMGRLAYRLAQLYFWNAATTAGQAPSTASSMNTRSPLTACLVFVLIGYYVVYYGAVLRKAGRISPEELEVVATPTTTTP